MQKIAFYRPSPLLLVFAFFCGLYFTLGTLISQTGALRNVDTFFDMDNIRVIRNMTVIDAKEHFRTEVHPFYVLLVNPIGAILAGTLDSEIQAALLLNAFLGALGVILSFFFFRFFVDTFDAWLLTFLFGFSSSQLLLSVLPETQTMAVVSLVLTYLLFAFTLRSRRPSLLLWVLIGAFSFGVTITNFVQPFILFGISSWILAEGKRRWQTWVVQLLKFVGIALLLAIVLALLQKFCYPTSKLFFLPEIYRPNANVIRFVNLENLWNNPEKILFQLLKYTFVFNFFAPVPVSVGARLAFSLSSEISPFGMLALLSWMFLWSRLAIEKWKHRGDEEDINFSLYFGFLLCLLFNMALHSIFYNPKFPGIEYFLYTGNFTFLVLALWAILCGRCVKRLRPFVIVLLLSMAGNNLLVVSQIVRMLS